MHKANVLKALTGLFLETGARGRAKDYEGRVECDERIIDACAMQLVMDPWQFDVIVTTNLFGDILSDLNAGLVGGLGMAPAGNIGVDAAIFEAVHGSAPDIAGKGIANPLALMLSAAMMLDHVRPAGQGQAPARRAIDDVLLQGQGAHRRPQAARRTRKQFTQAIVGRLDESVSDATFVKMVSDTGFPCAPNSSYPARRPELFAKAMASEADALSFDLEDAVDEQRKDEARIELARFLRTLPPNPGKVIIVRVNGLETPHFEADIEAIVGPGPRHREPAEARVARRRARVRGGARQGRAQGRRRSRSTSCRTSSRRARCAWPPRSRSPARAWCGLQAGWGDLIEPLDIDRYNPAVIESLQLQIRIAAGEAGIWAYDGAYANIKDPEGYRREAEAARRLGYLGKSAIHPSQVPDRQRGVPPDRRGDRALAQGGRGRAPPRRRRASAPTPSTGAWSTPRSCAARSRSSRWRKRLGLIAQEGRVE